MSAVTARMIGAFRRLRVLVIGDAMLDTYREGSASRLCQEAPVPIVAVDGCVAGPGGAANTAANVAGLGASVTLLALTGDDPTGALLCDAAGTRGVDMSHMVCVPGRETLTKERIIADGQLLLRFDGGDGAEPDILSQHAMATRLRCLAGRSDLIIVSDYGYGAMSPFVRQALVDARCASRRLLAVDARDLASYAPVRPDAIKPNYAEATRLLGVVPVHETGARAKQIAAGGEALLRRTGARIAAVTLDTDGAVVLARNSEAYRVHARPAPPMRASGAGDTFLAAFAMALATGAGRNEAADVASLAASIVVGASGTAVCTAAALHDAADGPPCMQDAAEAADRAMAARSAGKRVVFTNGCFDILHRGHVSLLERARALGDVLIVGINTDAGVRRLKGPSRPVNPLADRANVLAALGCVDLVVPFDEAAPLSLVRAIRPEVYVKGGDYRIDELPEAAEVASYGGSVELLAHNDDRSTTGIIERIRAPHPHVNGHARQEVRP